MQLRSKRVVGTMLACALVALGVTFVQSPADAKSPAKMPVAVSGPQAKAPVPAGSLDGFTKASQPLGTTKLLTLDPSGKAISLPRAAPNAGNDSTIDITSIYNYCQGNLTYTYVHNYSSVTKYIEVVLYANSGTRTFYTSIAAGGTAYPTWYGVTGTYYAYLYVWNGSSYAYDEYRASANNCAVSVSMTTSSGYTGYLLLTISNTGSDYADVLTNELSPYPIASWAPSSIYAPYVGAHWDYPAPGGTLYRYVYVGTGLKYGLYVNLYGANYYTPWYWYGVL